MRCEECDQKYRIKSSYFERELKTGPRTLDEADDVLRSDSVDIDPDEVSPVSIDDDGNVVGLSGLSELMRGFDEKDAKAGKDAKDKLKTRLQEEQDLPPAATPASKSKKSGKRKSGSFKTNTTDRTEAKPASKPARRRKKKSNLPIVLAVSIALLVAVGLVVVIVTAPTGNDGSGSADAGNDPGQTDPDLTGSDRPNPPGPDRTPPDNPDPVTPAPTLFAFSEPPMSNPDPKFVEPWPSDTASPESQDFPARINQPIVIEHEGWYLMDPPRERDASTGVETVRFVDPEVSELAGGKTLIVGKLLNSSEQNVVTGELHVMLLNADGKVFAETYSPIAVVEPRTYRPLALEIPTRHFAGTRQIRSEVLVSEWADKLKTIPVVNGDIQGQDTSTVVRITARNEGEERTIRTATIVVNALDTRKKPIRDFMLHSQRVNIKPGGLMDIVVATPLPEDRPAAEWNIRVYVK